MVDATLEQAAKGHPVKISRRSLIKAGAAALVLAATGGSVGYLGVPWLTDEPQRSIDPLLINRELKNDLSLGSERAEFFSLWPYSRVWVVVNNLIAANKLDGLRFKKGQEYSLVKLLDLERDYSGNTDPQKGYITGLHPHSEPPFISLVESQGLSLTANCMARAVALSPISVKEWHTHTDIDEFTKHYFDPKIQYKTHPIFSKLGTDATVYTGKTNTVDFRFTPLEDCTLRYLVLDEQGKTFSMPSVVSTLLQYPASLTKRFTKPLLVRVVVGGNNFGDYNIELESFQTQRRGKVVPGFERIIRKNKGEVSHERFEASYDIAGNFAA